jgi:hypothetical protein
MNALTKMDGLALVVVSSPDPAVPSILVPELWARLEEEEVLLVAETERR